MVAQWSANEAHIRYNPNPPAGKTAGGNGTPNWDGHTGDTPAIRGNGWTIDGYTFAGWTTNADGGGTKYAPGASWTASGTLTLYAQWTPGQASLTYDGNGATGGNTAAQSGKTGDELTTNANGFTRDGYTFVRWDTAKDGSGTAYGEGKNGVSQYVMTPAGNEHHRQHTRHHRQHRRHGDHQPEQLRPSRLHVHRLEHQQTRRPKPATGRQTHA